MKHPGRWTGSYDHALIINVTHPTFKIPAGYLSTTISFRLVIRP